MKRDAKAQTHGAGFPSRMDGFVPHYNIFGHQHHKMPTVDLKFYESEKENNFYKTAAPWGASAKPQVNPTRTALFQARKQQCVPHISYDFDGDGVIGARDYFIGKSFDKDRDDRLSKEEREEAIKALKNGWLDQFSFGHDQAAAKRPYPIVQRRGKIMTIDNGDVMQETYPKHWNHDVNPRHRTMTEITNDRSSELKGAANDLINKFCEENPRLIRELPVEQEWSVEHPRISRISDRAEADHQESRVRAGLLPINSHLNPDRETLQPGLTYIEDPEFKTRSDLKATRRDLKIRDLETNRRLGEEQYVPLSVRKSKYEMACTRFRGTHVGTGRTKTLMVEQRRRDRIEYDRTHFQTQEKSYNRYSDQNELWFILNQKVTNPAALEMVHGKTRSELQRAQSVPAPSFKVTEQIPFEDATNVRPQTENFDRKEHNMWIKERKSKLRPWDAGGTTVTRWTTDIIKSGAGRNCPRLFDSLPRQHTTAVDFMPLETFSSFDWTRNETLKKTAELKCYNQDNPLWSRFYSERNTGHSRQSSRGGAPQASSTGDLASAVGGGSVFVTKSGVDANMMTRTASNWQNHATTSNSASIPNPQQTGGSANTFGGANAGTVSFGGGATHFAVRSGGFQRMEQSGIKT